MANYSNRRRPNRVRRHSIAPRQGGDGLAKDKARPVFMVADHAVVRRALCQLLKSSSGWESCAHGHTGEACLRVAPKCNPDVIVTDISMPRMGRSEATPAIHAALPQVKIIVQTIHKIAELVRVGLAAGSWLHTDREDRTLEALETVMRGDVYIAPSFGRRVIAAVAK